MENNMIKIGSNIILIGDKFPVEPQVLADLFRYELLEIDIPWDKNCDIDEWTKLKWDTFFTLPDNLTKTVIVMRGLMALNDSVMKKLNSIGVVITFFYPIADLEAPFDKIRARFQG